MTKVKTLERFPYNGDPVVVKEAKDVKFSCDCRSECQFNTGYAWKSGQYGYAG